MKINFTNKPFSFFLILSLFFHLIVILFFIGSKSFPQLFKKDRELLIQNAIRVDSIGLPDFQEKQKPKKETPSPAIQKRKKKKPADPKKKKEKRKNTKSEKSKNTPPLNKGNKLSKGTQSGQGAPSTQQLSEIQAYMSQVDSQIRNQWIPEKHLTDKRFTAQIEIKINEQGQIIYKRILVSSGNELFDSFALKAIENAEPYPAPPSSIQTFIKDGIVIKLSSRD